MEIYASTYDMILEESTLGRTWACITDQQPQVTMIFYYTIIDQYILPFTKQH